MNHRSSTSTLALFLAALALGSCSVMDPFDDDDSARVPVDPDLRLHVRNARTNLPLLSPEKRAVVEPLLVTHEQAIREYDRLMAMGQTRRAAYAPLLGAGAYVVGNDVTGVGVADDVALPFLAVGAVVVAAVTSAPASTKALQRALDKVRDSGQNLSRVYSRVDESSEPIAAPGTREHCIDRYVDCQLNARRGYSRGGCQMCMDWCMGGGFIWPDKRVCRYKDR